MTPSQPKQRDLANEIKAQRQASFIWMLNNYYDEFTQVFQSYKCNRDPEKDPNKPGENDPSQTSIGMPDTFALVNRQTARLTAQAPNLRFRADDSELAMRISRKLMYDWDRAGVQRLQKKHVRQALMFGWSVRAWSWEQLEFQRTKRIDPLGTLTEEDRLAVTQQYGDDLNDISTNENVPPDSPAAMAHLLGRNSRGGLLPIKYLYTKYSGPRADFLFIGDCFPEPNFQSLQSSNFFICRRRRNMQWIKSVVQRYPDMAQGMNDVLSRYPRGTPNNFYAREDQTLRQQLFAAADRVDNTYDTTTPATPGWTFYERHIPGSQARMAIIAEDDVWVGEIPYPYDLDGKIAFSELILIDDILGGIGDSQARILRGLQQLHDRQVNTRFDLIYNILRPLYFTNDDNLYDNPEQLKRGPGFRLVRARGGAASVQPMGEQAAIASAAAGMNDEEGWNRLWQAATGESNMSMAANVDPQQARTATGARLMAYNLDILSKDMNDMLLVTSLNEDADIMYLLNRSEMPEAVTFDGAAYNRDWLSLINSPQQPGMMTVTPHDFQVDGEVEAEAGSTLADDDDAKVQRAQVMLQTAMNSPLLNKQTATVEWLIANGKGKELQQWLQPPPPGPPPAEPMRETLTLSVKFETLPVEVQQAIMGKAGIPWPTAAPPAPLPAPPAPAGPPAVPTTPPGAAGVPGNPPTPPSEQTPMAVGPAMLAAEGKAH